MLSGMFTVSKLLKIILKEPLLKFPTNYKALLKQIYDLLGRINYAVYTDNFSSIEVLEPIFLQPIYESMVARSLLQLPSARAGDRYRQH